MRTLTLRTMSFFTLVILTAGTGLALRTHAQKISPTGRAWQLEYTVTLTGSGTEEPALGSSDPVITWSVKRTFGGRATLGLKESLPNIERFSGIASHSVDIDDFIEMTYPEVCEEYDVIKQTWKLPNFDTRTAEIRGVQYLHQEPFQLMMNTGANTHSLDFGLDVDTTTLQNYPDDRGVGLSKSYRLEVMYERRTTHFPTRKEVLNEKGPRTNSTNVRIPFVEGWIVQGKPNKKAALNLRSLVRRDAALPRKDGRVYRVESQPIPIEENMLDGVDTRGKVMLKVTYMLIQIDRPTDDK